jgi:peptidyl-prolyl cis-trans isomerase D
MLKIMRDSFQHLKWILIFIVALFILFVFVDWGAGGAQSRKGDVGFAARVNGDTVSVQDYTRAEVFTEKRLEEQYGQPVNDQMRQMLGIPRGVMNQLIDQALLVQQAEKLHLAATPEEVRKKILEIPVLNPNGQFVGADLYRRYITGSLGYATVSDFEREIERDLTITKIESALENSVSVPPQQAEAEYRRNTESAKVRYVLLPTDRVLSSIRVTPTDVEAFYRANPTRYTHGDQRSVKYLIADLAQIRSRMMIDTAQLQAEYEKNKEAFKGKEAVHAQHILIKVAPNATPQEDAAAKARADALVAQLRAGADFATLAKANSADPGSAVKGGDVGFFERGQMVPEFEQKAFALNPGEIGEPVKTQFGYHILKVLEKRPAGYKPFEEVRGQLMMQLVGQRAKSDAREQIASVRARVNQVKPKSDDQVRNMTSATIAYDNAQWFGKNDPITGFGRLPALTEWAFSAKQGDWGPIIDTPRGPMIPWLVGSRGAGVTPLDEIRPKVEADGRGEKARAAAVSALAQNLPAASIDELGKKLGIEVKETSLSRNGFSPSFSGNIDALVTAALSAQIGQVKGPIQVDQGAVAFQVAEQKKFEPAEFAKLRDMYLQSLRQDQARKLRNSLLEQLRKSSKIEINEKLLQEGSGTPES